MIDLNRIYMLEMMRKRRLADTVREDVAWDILVETGGATHTIKVQCLSGQTANIDWGDNTSTEATATTLTSYSHDYPAGTFTISITGGASTFRHGVALTDVQRTTLIRNLNLAGMTTLGSAFRSTTIGSDYNSACIGFAENCRIAQGVTNISECFRNMRAIAAIAPTMQIPAGITTAYRCFASAIALQNIPLSFWPTGGFTSTGTIDLRDLFAYCGNITGSIAPSQILWDSGKTFSVNRMTFYPNKATAWLNYAADYTDPVSGITYSKIPYAWGGAAD